MYKQQNGETDQATRVDIVKKMQQMLYQDSPYIVTVYTTTGEAVRTDRFACFQPQPDPGGVWLVQYGAHNYSELRPGRRGRATATVSRRRWSRAVSSASSDDGRQQHGCDRSSVASCSWLLVAGGASCS